MTSIGMIRFKASIVSPNRALPQDAVRLPRPFSINKLLKASFSGEHLGNGSKGNRAADAKPRNQRRRAPGKDARIGKRKSTTAAWAALCSRTWSLVAFALLFCRFLLRLDAHYA